MFPILALFVGLTASSISAQPRPSVIDVHVHGYCSDGIKTPEQLAAETKARGLSYWALTDHDTLACLKRAATASKAEGIAFIPGVELSAEDDTIHLLGIGVDADEPSFAALFESLNEDRFTRLESIVAKLGGIGAKLDINVDVLMPKLNRERIADGQPPMMPAEAAALSTADLAARVRGQITRPDIAKALIARGYAKNNKEAFDKYIGTGGPGYVALAAPPFRDAIAAIHSAGGIAILAHAYTIYESKFKESAATPTPVTYSGKTYPDFDTLAEDMLDAGLDGFEAYSPHRNSRNQARVEGIIARRKVKTGQDLLETPGSDYHGGPAAGIGPAAVGGMTMPPEMERRLLRALKLVP